MCSLLPSLDNAVLPSGFCAYELPVAIDQARSVLSLGTSEFLALERGSESVVRFFDTDGDGIADSRTTLASAPRLNHGLAVRDGYLYASSDQIVYRWAYTTGENQVKSDAQEVIFNINANGSGGAPFGHTTRTLVFDEAGRLYVSVGSNGNVDPDSFRSRIRRFDLSSFLEDQFPIDFVTGEVFADGLRNEVGLAFDSFGDLWGVENGADNLMRTDLGGDIHNDNPGEELNRFKEEDAGKHWGYPYCWTEFNLPVPPGLGQGTVWAWPSFLANVTDEDCRANYMTSELSMQAHTAPLGITFYSYTEETSPDCPSGVAFPKEMDGYAFIAMHGSWNRDVPVGYSVVYVEMDENGDVVGEPKDLLSHIPPFARWGDGFRPVDVDFDSCGRLLVSSDGSHNVNNYGGSKIVRIDAVTSNTPSGTPNSPSPEDVPPTNLQSSSAVRVASVLLFTAIHICLVICTL